jgi:hypothetical protein
VPPDTRMQRARWSPSALRLPLMRPLGAVKPCGCPQIQCRRRLRPFVPAKDPGLSKASMLISDSRSRWSDQVAGFRSSSFRFLLQTFYVKQHAENFAMSLSVEDADIPGRNTFSARSSRRSTRASCASPTMQPWGSECST